MNPIKRTSLLSATLAVSLSLFGCERIDLERERWALKSDGKVIDTYVINANVHTQSDTMPVAQAFGISNGEIVKVGSSDYIASLASSGAQKIDLNGALVLPGLHDIHIHVLMALTGGQCDIDNAEVNAAALVAFMNQCLADKTVKEGEWIILSQFSPTTLMQDMTPYKSIREALDSVSTTNPIFALGSDGHAFAGNSLALQYAQLPDMAQAVPITKESLAGFWRERGFAEYFGVDESGEPDGVVKDAGGYEVIRFAAPDPKALIDNPEKINHYLHSQGITSFQDAWIPPAEVPIWQALVDQQQLKLRGTLNLMMNGDQYRQDGELMIEQMVEDTHRFNQSISTNQYFKGDAVKVMLDGVMEYPTQTAAMIDPYLKPVVTDDMVVSHYASHQHKACADIDTALEGMQDDVFAKVHGFSSKDCVPNHGMLEFSEQELNHLVARLDNENILVHIHALGDRAVKVSLDAIEQAQQRNGTKIAHTLAHTQLVEKDDIARAGRLGVGLAPTYAWMANNWQYDITVMPFIDEMKDLNDLDHLYREDTYTYQQGYPMASLWNAGALVGAGSDAPVDVRSPRPFGNIAIGLSRAAQVTNAKGESKQVVWNGAERLTIEQLVQAYTINGAKLLRQENLVGSIEVGKRADFVVLDRDIYQLAKSQDIEAIANTQVTQTWFDGRLVYQAE